MKELQKDIFELAVEGNTICVLTNGVVKASGELVMGAGQAEACLDLVPGLDAVLGSFVQQYGNRAFNIGVTVGGFRVISFPTKEHFKAKSTLALIEKSAREVIEIADKFNLDNIFIPRPGCGLGGLDWNSQVKPLLSPILDDRFTIVSLEEVSKVEMLTDRPVAKVSTGQSKTSALNCIAVTGHRPKSLWGYGSTAAYQALQSAIFNAINMIINYDDKVDGFISGGAQGVDQLFYWVGHYMQRSTVGNKYVNSVYIPFEGQESKWKETGRFSQEEYNQMMGSANIIVNTNPDVVPGVTPYNQIASALYARNLRMIEDSNYVIAVYKGPIDDVTDPNSRGSGTLHALKNAMYQNKKILVINPTNLVITPINFDDIY